jgi:hypothetical protein
MDAPGYESRWEMGSIMRKEARGRRACGGRRLLGGARAEEGWRRRTGSIDSTLPSPNASLVESSGLEGNDDSTSYLHVVSLFFPLFPHLMARHISKIPTWQGN